MQEQEEYIILRDDDDDEVVAPPPKAETEATPEDEAKTEPSADETKTEVKPDKTKATPQAKSDAPPPTCNAWCAVGRRALPSWAWAMLATFAMSFLLTAAFAGGYNYGRVAPAAPGGDAYATVVVAATLAALCLFVRKAAAALLFRGRATTWRGLAAELRDEVAARRKPPD